MGSTVALLQLAQLINIRNIKTTLKDAGNKNNQIWGRCVGCMLATSVLPLVQYAKSQMYVLLVTNDDQDLPSVLLVADPGTEPLLEGLDGPSDLVSPGPGFDQDNVSAFDDQVAVEPSESDDVGVNVVDQAHVEHGGGTIWKKQGEGLE